MIGKYKGKSGHSKALKVQEKPNPWVIFSVNWILAKLKRPSDGLL
jgi:hypothetical protein